MERLARSPQALSLGGGRLGGKSLLEDGKLCPVPFLPSHVCLPCPQQIMKDKWINIGYEGEELKPYTEPEEDFGDTKRIGEGQGSRCFRLRGAVPQSQGWWPLPLLLWVSDLV